MAAGVSHAVLDNRSRQSGLTREIEANHLQGMRCVVCIRGNPVLNIVKEDL
jgi:hypothetical protein